jgi:oligoendopeptidase F
MVVITNTASVRGLAHEFGHILLNEGSKAHQDMDPEYLMSPAAPIPGERITPTQCGTIFANA